MEISGNEMTKVTFAIETVCKHNFKFTSISYIPGLSEIIRILVISLFEISGSHGGEYEYGL
jgi:hypothetical protein